jgi:gentisate 1,2-dioxygenase
MKSRKISKEDTNSFDRGDFQGYIYLDDDNSGLTTLEVVINGEHPQKQVDDVDVRIYRVEEGSGKFTIDGETMDASSGDVFTIVRGSEYSYQGKMTLFEINIKK